MSDCVTLVRLEAEKKSLRLIEKIGPHLHTVQADSRRLRQILLNLLNNAIKFTDAGEVGISAKLLTADKQAHQVVFEVWDTGIGIAAADQKQVFKPFFQVESGLGRHYGGAGLGLALVTELTKIHDGTITIESEVGDGSRFILTLPNATTTDDQQNDHKRGTSMQVLDLSLIHI